MMTMQKKSCWGRCTLFKVLHSLGFTAVIALQVDNANVHPIGLVVAAKIGHERSPDLVRKRQVCVPSPDAQV